jgi:hypothetical protein
MRVMPRNAKRHSISLLRQICDSGGSKSATTTQWPCIAGGHKTFTQSWENILADDGLVGAGAVTGAPTNFHKLRESHDL